MSVQPQRYHGQPHLTLQVMMYILGLLYRSHQRLTLLQHLILQVHYQSLQHIIGK